MAEASGYRTRVSILMALRNDPSDQAAWSAFVDRYGPQIHAWCRRWKLQEADAQDVTQMVLVKLVRQLPNFTYDPSRSFRGWLRTLTAHSWSDFIGDQVRGVRGSADSVVSETLNRAVAIKMLHPGLFPTDADRRRLRAEAEAVARLQHPNVVQLYEIGESRGSLYPVFEYVSGGPLE